MSPISSKPSHYPESINPDTGSEIQFLEEHIKRIPQPVFELLDSVVPQTFSMGEKYDGNNQSCVEKPNAGEIYQNIYPALGKTYWNGQPIHHGYQHLNNSNQHVHTAPANHAPIHHALIPPAPIHHALINLGHPEYRGGFQGAQFPNYYQMQAFYAQQQQQYQDQM